MKTTERSNMTTLATLTDAQVVEEAQSYGLDVEAGRCDIATVRDSLLTLRHVEPEIRPALVAHMNDGWPYWTFNPDNEYMGG